MAFVDQHEPVWQIATSIMYSGIIFLDQVHNLTRELLHRELNTFLPRRSSTGVHDQSNVIQVQMIYRIHMRMTSCPTLWTLVGLVAPAAPGFVRKSYIARHLDPVLSSSAACTNDHHQIKRWFYVRPMFKCAQFVLVHAPITPFMYLSVKFKRNLEIENVVIPWWMNPDHSSSFQIIHQSDRK